MFRERFPCFPPRENAQKTLPGGSQVDGSPPAQQQLLWEKYYRWWIRDALNESDETWQNSYQMHFAWLQWRSSLYLNVKDTYSDKIKNVRRIYLEELWIDTIMFGLPLSSTRHMRNASLELFVIYVDAVCVGVLQTMSVIHSAAVRACNSFGIELTPINNLLEWDSFRGGGGTCQAYPPSADNVFTCPALWAFRHGLRPASPNQLDSSRLSWWAPPRPMRIYPAGYGGH